MKREAGARLGLALALTVAALGRCVVADSEGSDKAGCSKLCKPAYIGDKNCDSECFNSGCSWDGGDCDDQWELRRMIVMGPYYKSVDHVEYTLVGPGGQTKQISYEEGRQWEGADLASKDMENDWISLLDTDDEDNLPDPSKRTYEHAPWKKEGVEVTL